MPYAIYRFNTDELLCGYDANGKPTWIPATGDREDCIRFPDWSAAEKESDRLQDEFRYATIVVNLENKQF